MKIVLNVVTEGSPDQRVEIDDDFCLHTLAEEFKRVGVVAFEIIGTIAEGVAKH